MLIEELAGGVVILDPQPRAGHAVVCGGLLDRRQGRLDASMVEVADPDLDRFSRKRRSGQQSQADRADQPSDHDSSQTSVLCLKGSWLQARRNNSRLASPPLMLGRPVQAFRRVACQRRWSLMNVEMK